MDKNVEEAANSRLGALKNRLENNGFNCVVLENADEAKELIRSTIEDGSTVSMGGSQSVRELGIEEILCSMNINFLDKNARSKSEEERNVLRRQAFMADYYLASCNAISMDGHLFNIDGRGNRVAAISFGPKKVYLFVGENKIVNNEEEAWTRIRNVAAIANNIRLNNDTPCRKAGMCVNCSSDMRICNQFSKIVKCFEKDRITVALVKGSWGY